MLSTNQGLRGMGFFLELPQVSCSAIYNNASIWERQSSRLHINLNHSTYRFLKSAHTTNAWHISIIWRGREARGEEKKILRDGIVPIHVQTQIWEGINKKPHCSSDGSKIHLSFLFTKLRLTCSLMLCLLENINYYHSLCWLNVFGCLWWKESF